MSLRGSDRWQGESLVSVCLILCFRDCGHCSVFRAQHRGKWDLTPVLGTNRSQTCWAETAGGWILHCPCSLCLGK